MSSLKYFKKNANDYQVIAAGSLQLYFIIGGMPECVSSWERYNDTEIISQIQRERTELYENDFPKHYGKVNSGRLLMVFRSIPAQLAKLNEKFMYGAVREGGRARDFEKAIEWLVSAGILNRVFNVSKAEHPLSVFDRQGCFKFFLFDTGLLKSVSGIDNSAILLKSDCQFKDPLTENYTLQLCGQFQTLPRYFEDKSSEIDFLIQRGTEIIPVEVKRGEDKSASSFKSYSGKAAETCHPFFQTVISGKRTYYQYTAVSCRQSG